MRFGGHETFHIREGWLYKGLSLLKEAAQNLNTVEAADLMGVGGNMAKSIHHWMLAMGLASNNNGGSAKLSLSPLGELIQEYDPYCTSVSTWWALHINLVSNPNYAASWDWFFNLSGQNRFEKGVALEQFKRFLKRDSNYRVPANKTLDRDLSFLLHSYGRAIPTESHDPEDSRECPFRELGLLTFFRESGFYKIQFTEKPIPPEILGYALSRRFPDQDGRDGSVSVSVNDASNTSNSPGKVFCLRAESVFELALKAQIVLPKGWLNVTGLAGTRYINFRAWPAEQWLGEAYRKENESEVKWLKNQKNNL